MLYKRSAAIAAAFAAALVSPVLAAASASAIYLPWTEQTVFAIGPTGTYVAEWMGLSQGWTIIGGPAGEIYAGSAGVFASNPTSGDIYEYNGTPNSWTEIGGPEGYSTLNDIAVGSGGVYLVQVYSGNGSSWTVIGGPAKPNLAAGG